MLAVALTLLVEIDTAGAASSTVRISVSHAKVGVPYAITVRGRAVGRKHLYLFADTRKCGASPAAEFARSQPTGTASGYYVPAAAGRYALAMRFRTGAHLADHACAYLTDSSERINSSRGVLAHEFKTFKVLGPNHARDPSPSAKVAAVGQPPVCSEAYPDAHSTTIGRTTWYNRQRSVQYVVCDGFGLNPSADFNTDGLACGLTSVALGALDQDKLALFVDGSCSAEALVNAPKSPDTYLGIACSWASDLLGAVAKGPGILGGAGCALAPVVGDALGGVFESGHELDVARDILNRGKCLKYSPTHFGSPWLADDCASNDPGFSILPRVDNRPGKPPAATGTTLSSTQPAPIGNPNSTGATPSLPAREFSVMNASGGVYWRSAADWNTPEATVGNGFYPGTIISVACYQNGAANVPGSANSMWEQASWVSGPGSGHGWINEHYVADGSAINQPSPGVPPCSSPPPPPLPPPPPAQTWNETAGGVAHTWTNYTNAGGTQGPSIAGGQTVQIACRLPGFQVADGNRWWYEIASAPWSGNYYVSADAFYNNGQTSGSLIGTPWVDQAVSVCPDANATGIPTGPSPPPPPPPQTWNETAGGVAHTWTNYTNAGGTQGPSIAGGQTVQIACKLTGFRVADGNTWWYRIASAPWSGNYYVSADAFYNNGQTSGSLVGTPWVDAAVGNC